MNIDVFLYWLMIYLIIGVAVAIVIGIAPASSHGKMTLNVAIAVTAFWLFVLPMSVVLIAIDTYKTKQNAKDETQLKISNWARRQFGVASPKMVVARLEEEVTELYAVIESGSGDDYLIDIADEAADVAILLDQIFEMHGLDRQSCVNDKMKINRARDWTLRGNGYQHKGE